jgi:hypothetical protein
MTLTWTFDFPSLDVAPDFDGKHDVVQTVHWRLTGALASGETASTYGSFAVPYDPEAEFTAFADIKRADLRAWMKASIDLPSVKSAIKAQLKAGIDPPIVSTAPPFDGGTAGTDARARKASKAAVLAEIDAASVE